MTVRAVAKGYAKAAKLYVKDMHNVLVRVKEAAKIIVVEMRAKTDVSPLAKDPVKRGRRRTNRRERRRRLQRPKR